MLVQEPYPMHVQEPSAMHVQESYPMHVQEPYPMHVQEVNALDDVQSNAAALSVPLQLFWPVTQALQGVFEITPLHHRPTL